MPGDGGYLRLGFFPQLVFWVGYTITIGVLSGTLVAALMRLWNRGALPIPDAA